MTEENEQVQAEQAEDNRSLHEIFFENNYKEPEPEAEVAVEPEPEVETVETEMAATPEAEPVAEPEPEPVVQKEKKKIWTPETEQSTYEQLSKKYAYKSLSDDQKAMAFIAAKNPALNDEELMFLAATDYGIGAETVEETDLTQEQIIGLKKQAIEKKKLIAEANGYFEQQADSVALAEPELDEDPEYVQYKEQKVAQQAEQARMQEIRTTTQQQIETNAKKITEISVPLEIDIDDRKLPVDVKFKLDADKQKKVIDYVNNYAPGKEEVAEFTDPATGKFDYAGYITNQVPKVFAKELLATGIKQALAKDREQFIEKELKNSTLRNNDVSQTVDRPFDMVEAWPFGK